MASLLCRVRQSTLVGWGGSGGKGGRARLRREERERDEGEKKGKGEEKKAKGEPTEERKNRTERRQTGGNRLHWENCFSNRAAFASHPFGKKKRGTEGREEEEREWL